MDTKDVLVLRELLTSAVEILDREIMTNVEPNSCPHQDRLEMTVLGSKAKSFMCNTCGAQWKEQQDDGEILKGLRGFGGSR